MSLRRAVLCFGPKLRFGQGHQVAQVVPTLRDANLVGSPVTQASAACHTTQNPSSGQYRGVRGILVAAAASVSAVLLGFSSSYTDFAEAKQPAKKYPTIPRKDVEKHKTASTGIWCTYGDGVYDITEFVSGHPGGDKIMLAAGGALEPFWQMYAQHKQEGIYQMLERMRIGTLPEKDRITASTSPYANDPKRHESITSRSTTPFNGETPLAALLSFITPTELHFKRNHLPVPDALAEAYELQVVNAEGDVALTMTLDDLKTKYPKHSVTMTLQCAGNRRSEMHAEREVKGLQWTNCAISTATWSGAKLSDVLRDISAKEGPDSVHVQFIGLDCDASGERYGASIPIAKALADTGDCILAYEMNGMPLTRDHGYPVRAMVPGHVAARSVKWLDKIVVSTDESDSHWQRHDYKGFCPDEDWANLDWSKAPAIQETPVTSAIVVPQPDESIPTANGVFTVKGYAFAGGGREVVRVDVSADGGKTWRPANLVKREDAAHVGYRQYWTWKHWEVDVPVPKEKGSQVQLVCKAVDDSYNVQPETFAPIYNARGVLSNAWHRLNVKVA